MRKSVHNEIPRAPYVILFDLNWTAKQRRQLAGRYVLYACAKGTWEALRAHFRSCKISKFSRGVPPDPPHTVLTPFLYFPWAPTILSAALIVTVWKGVSTVVWCYRSNHRLLAICYRSERNSTRNELTLLYGSYTPLLLSLGTIRIRNIRLDKCLLIDALIWLWFVW